MSCRHLVLDMRLSSGERVGIYRDCESRTYRLFINDDGDSIDCTIEEWRRLSETIAQSVKDHEEWGAED